MQGIVFRTGAPYTGDCFQDGCTPKLTGARAPGAPVLTEALTDMDLVNILNGQFETL